MSVIVEQPGVKFGASGIGMYCMLESFVDKQGLQQSPGVYGLWGMQDSIEYISDPVYVGDRLTGSKKCAFRLKILTIDGECEEVLVMSDFVGRGGEKKILDRLIDAGLCIENNEKLLMYLRAQANNKLKL